MPALRSREVSFVIAGFALMSVLSIAAAIVSPPAAENLPAGSSFSRQPNGAAAAFLTLQRLGHTIRRSFDPVSALAVDPASTVLILADPAEAPSNADRRALQSLVTAGATVLTTGCGGLSFLTDFVIPDSLNRGEPRVFSARFPSPLSAGAPRISMRAECSSPAGLDRYTTLYGDDRDAAVRFARFGTGMTVWWAGSTPLSNESIDGPGQIEALLDVVGAPGRTILWDEFYHGQRRSLYSYAKRTPLPWAAAQIVLAALVAAAMYARRRAPILDRPEPSRASPLEFVDTMAGLYARAGAAADAVTVARTRLRRLLAAATGLGPEASDERLAAAAAARRRVDAGELRAALQASSAARADTVTADEVLPLVRRLQACAAALELTGG